MWGLWMIGGYTPDTRAAVKASGPLDFCLVVYLSGIQSNISISAVHDILHS